MAPPKRLALLVITSWFLSWRLAEDGEVNPAADGEVNEVIEVKDDGKGSSSGRDVAADEDGAALTSWHYGTKPGHFETLKIHFPTSEGVSKVSERANE